MSVVADEVVVGCVEVNVFLAVASDVTFHGLKTENSASTVFV